MTTSPGEKKTSPGEREEDPRMGLPDSVRVVEAPAPMVLQQAVPGAHGPWIEYIGVGTVRTMTKKDWADQGIDSDKYCEWNYLNHKRLPRDMFNDKELQYLLRVDDRFKLVESESDTTE